MLGTVTRLSPVQALLSIGVVDGVPLPAGEEFVGVVRTQDVRATEKDRVKIGDCFRGGDVVRGVVVRVSSALHLLMQTKFQISLGDARSYFVTTARNDLGVIFATSEAGRKAMLPGYGPTYICGQGQPWSLCLGRKCAAQRRASWRNASVQNQRTCKRICSTLLVYTRHNPNKE